MTELYNKLEREMIVRLAKQIQDLVSAPRYQQRRVQELTVYELPRFYDDLASMLDNVATLCDEIVAEASEDDEVGRMLDVER